MDTKFQTSFIPKKSSIVEQKTIRHARSTNIFTIIAVLVFTASVAGAVFSVVWKKVLLEHQKGYQTSLEQAEAEFNKDDSVTKLRKASAKLQLSKVILNNHIATSEIFDILSALTIEGVKFDSFDFESGTPDSPQGLSVEMKGVGTSFSAIAYQSDVFGQSQRFGVNRVLRNPIISDLLIKENGSVGFTFKADINPTDITYTSTLEGNNGTGQ